MADIELSGGFDWGPIRTGMGQMRAFVSQTTAGINKDIGSMFTPVGIGRFLVGGALVEGLRAIIDHAQEIHHEAERFGLDAEQLQRIANPAKEVGISMEQVARAMKWLKSPAQSGRRRKIGKRRVTATRN